LKRLQEFYTGDPGVLVAPFFMNLIKLEPGEAIYVGADGCHAWLDGQIVELMATSDNVMNLAFVPPEEKDDVNIFIDAVTCEPASGESYKLARTRFSKSIAEDTEEEGATVYKVPTEAFSIYHVPKSGEITILPLTGPSIAIITSTSTSTSSSKITEKGEQPMDVKEGQVYFIGAGTEWTVGDGVEVWCAFYDDERQDETGKMK